MEAAYFLILPHVPEFHKAILAAAEQLVGVVGEGKGHNRLFVGLKVVNKFGVIENSDDSVFEGPGNDIAVGNDSTYGLLTCWWRFVRLLGSRCCWLAFDFLD